MHDTLRRLSIRTKLMAGFGVLMLVTALLGLFCLRQMGVMNDAAEVVRGNTLPSILSLAQIQGTALRFRLYEGRLIMSTTTAAIATEEKALAELGQSLTNSRMAFQPLIEPGEERDRFDQIDALWKNYGGLHEKLLRLAHEGDRVGLENLFKGEMAEVFNHITDLLLADMAYNKALGNNAANFGRMTYDTAFTLTVTCLGAALTLALVMSLAMNQTISVPLTRMTLFMRRLAQRDLAAPVPYVGRGDEIGAMATAVQVFKDSMIRSDEAEGRAGQIRLANNRRQAAVDRHTQDFGASVSGVMGGLVRSAESMRAAAVGMSQTSQQTQASASRTAEGAAQSSHSLGAVAAAAEEMSASINEISQQVTRATTSVRQAVDRASETDAKMHDLSRTTEQVGNVVGLIASITGQTNLLALNATIEAARAGETGRGFAVVAGEVKALAAQTARATAEISQQIEAIRNETVAVVGAVQDVTAAIGQVDAVATAIATAVEQQAASTREIAASVQSVSLATEAAVQSMEEVSSLSHNAEAGSRAVLTNADEVGNTARLLQTEVNQFLLAIANNSEESRRRYERIPGGGAVAKLLMAEHGEGRGTIQDISRGGLALACAWTADAGADIEMDLPGAADPVHGRIVRSGSGMLAVAFRQDPATLAQVDRVLAAILPGGTGRLAA